MAFQIPKLSDLLVRTRTSMNAEMPGTDAYVWPNNLYVISKVFAGAIYELFLRLEYVSKQIFAATATDDYLDAHGFEYGIARKAASPAYGDILVTGTPGATIPSGATLTRSDGRTYTTQQSATIPATGQVKVPVIDIEPGLKGNAQQGTKLTFSATLTNVDGDAYVTASGLGQGSNIETDDSYRQRILERKRRPPQGGAEYDYIAWAKQLPGVTRVFVKGNAYGPGTVGVWFTMDETYPFGIPQPADVAAVQAHLDLLKPITANVFVAAPVAECIDVVVKGLSPDTLEVRQAAADELVAAVRRLGSVSVPGALVTIHRSWLWQAVSNASGEQYHVIEAPGSDIVSPAGSIPVVRKVTFQ